MRIVRLPWPERLRDWWRCSVCGSRFGHCNFLYEENHRLRDRNKELEGEVARLKAALAKTYQGGVPRALKKETGDG